MALITIEISDDKLAACVDAIAQVRLYPDQVDGQPNPVSKAVFGKNVLAKALVAYVEGQLSGWISSAVKMNASKEVKGQVSSSIS